MRSGPASITMRRRSGGTGPRWRFSACRDRCARWRGVSCWGIPNGSSASEAPSESALSGCSARQVAGVSPSAPPTLMITVGGIATKPRYLTGSWNPVSFSTSPSLSTTRSSTAPQRPGSHDGLPCWLSRPPGCQLAGGRSRKSPALGCVSQDHSGRWGRGLRPPRPARPPIPDLDTGSLQGLSVTPGRRHGS